MIVLKSIFTEGSCLAMGVIVVMRAGQEWHVMRDCVWMIATTGAYATMGLATALGMSGQGTLVNSDSVRMSAIIMVGVHRKDYVTVRLDTQESYVRPKCVSGMTRTCYVVDMAPVTSPPMSVYVIRAG